jgi:hypothetical protein
MPDDENIESFSSGDLPSFNRADFNIGSFRLSQAFDDHAGGEKLLNTIPVRKPLKETFVRTHPDPAYRFQAVVLELKERGETYLVKPSLLPELQGESTLASKILVPTLTRQNALHLWPIKLPGPDGSLDQWNQSALEASEEARTKWVRMVANRFVGAYDIIVARTYNDDPTWPNKTVEELVTIAFKGRMITALDHPVIRALRGEA